MVFMAIFSPSCWVATYSVLLTPLILCVALLAARPAAVIRDPALACGAVAFGLCTALTHSKVWRAIGIPTFKGESYVYLVLMILPLLGLSLAWLLWRARRYLTYDIH
jgi:hypothetical protein